MMFAERGLRATTVRDIADGAGILSGHSLHPNRVSTKRLLGLTVARRWPFIYCAADFIENAYGLFAAAVWSLTFGLAQ
ncbi:hypothetical protein A5635_00890 [Mycobacterium asiaticum]|uniref:HTH tetR-type domain-containing protein n=1 Tax=Mycobacterium asiaticum TaxID=1790 RepID=A0A1A3NVE3_MYCAS|nr:hypothetical protein A5635_00890 [Mycobacterium asiaticum]